MDISGTVTSMDASYTLSCVIGACNLLSGDFLQSCSNYNNCPTFCSERIPCGSGVHVGYMKQINIGDWEGFINSPLSVYMDNYKIFVWDYEGSGIVYYNPSSGYVLMLDYSVYFDPQVQISDGQEFSIQYSINYTYGGNIVLTANYNITGTLNCHYLSGSIYANIVALDPAFNAYAGNFYWVFEAGSYENTQFGYLAQTNIGEWEGFINSPLSVDFNNLSLSYWNPEGFPMIYLASSGYIISLGYGHQIQPPFYIGEYGDYSLNFSHLYINSNGIPVLEGYYYVFGTFSCPYFSYGEKEAEIITLDPAYNPLTGAYFFNYKTGIYIPADMRLLILKIKELKSNPIKLKGKFDGKSLNK